MPIEFSPRLQSALGIVMFIAFAWLMSERKRAFPLWTAIWATAAQILIAFVVLYTPPAQAVLRALNGLVEALQLATLEGTYFIFGYLGDTSRLPPTIDPGTPEARSTFFVFAFQALPLIIFMSALAAALWHMGVLKAIIRALAAALERLFGIGGAVALSASANIFFGQTEAPLLIRAYLEKLTRSELFAVITCGYATVAGTVVVLYASILAPIDPEALGHILLASLISAPAALLMARIIMPPAEGEHPTAASAADDFKYDGVIDAFSHGATEGMKLYLNIIASIIAFLALAALINLGLAAVLPEIGGGEVTIERALGLFFAPIVWLAGVPASEAMAAGELMGVKTALNEVVAYYRLATEYSDLDPRSKTIMIYALCGFANIGSLGIVIGGFSAIAPGRRQDVIQLAPRAIVGGTLATLSTGAVVGLIWQG